MYKFIYFGHSHLRSLLSNWMKGMLNIPVVLRNKRSTIFSFHHRSALRNDGEIMDFPPDLWSGGKLVPEEKQYD
jgi:hypothetical protein